MNFHVANFKESVEVWVKGVDTFKLQCKSLQYFLGNLGYRLDTGMLTDQAHIHNNKGMFMSLRDAVRLHNGKVRWGDYDMWGFTQDQLDEAYSAKLVHKVKIRRSKRKGL